MKEREVLKTINASKDQMRSLFIGEVMDESYQSLERPKIADYSDVLPILTIDFNADNSWEPARIELKH